MMINFSFKSHNNFGVSSTHQFQISSPPTPPSPSHTSWNLRDCVWIFPPSFSSLYFGIFPFHFRLSLCSASATSHGRKEKSSSFNYTRSCSWFWCVLSSLVVLAICVLWPTVLTFLLLSLYPHSLARRVVKGSWLVSRNVKNRSFREAKFLAASSFMFGNKLIEGCSLSRWRIFFWLFI